VRIGDRSVGIGGGGTAPPIRVHRLLGVLVGFGLVLVASSARPGSLASASVVTLAATPAPAAPTPAATAVTTTQAAPTTTPAAASPTPAATAPAAATTTPATAAARPLPTATVCRRIRAISAAKRLAGGRQRLTLLATGDSLIYPIDEELGVEAPPGLHVVTARHDGTGLTTSAVDWRALSAHQAKTIHPNVTVISLGGRDGGIPLPAPNSQPVACCGPQWLALYAARVRPLVRAYVQSGHGRVYWLLLPAPAEAARAPLFAAVNSADRLLVPEFHGALRVIPVDAVVSPGGFQNTITFDGMQIAPRTADGIHLNHAGACVEASLVDAALRADGLVR
jgi:hypothetical protein